MRLHLHHPVDHTALLAFVVGPVLFLALAALAVAVQDAPVQHAGLIAHAALSSR